MDQKVYGILRLLKFPDVVFTILFSTIFSLTILVPIVLLLLLLLFNYDSCPQVLLLLLLLHQEILIGVIFRKLFGP